MKLNLPIIIFLIIFGLGAVIAVKYDRDRNLFRTKEQTGNVNNQPSTSEATKENNTPVTTGTQLSTIAPKSPSLAKLTLTITSPVNNTTVKSNTLLVKGKTKPRAEVFVNETEAAADTLGNFSVNVQLDEGENYLIVFVNDEEGNSVEQELTVTYDSGQ